MWLQAMTEEPVKAKYSVCPHKCKISKLDASVIDGIDTDIANGLPVDDIVAKYPLALLNYGNVNLHKHKHLNMAKIMLEKGITVAPTSTALKTVEQEVKEIQEANPELANKLSALGKSDALPFKSIDLVVGRIGVVNDVLKELYGLPARPYKICSLFEQVMQRWVDIYSRLTGEMYKAQVSNNVDMSTVSSWIIKQASKNQDVVVAKPIVVKPESGV
jgi:hypothetical protein